MKQKLTYLFLIIMAILFGHLLGNVVLALEEPTLSWLGQSLNFGFDTTTVNFSAFTISLGLQVSINTLQIMFIALAIVLAPKVAASIK